MTSDELIKRYAELGEAMREMEESGRASDARASKCLSNMKKIADESQRVANVAHDAPRILEELDREFEAKTGLEPLDMAFLFLAAALQCVRWAVLSNEKFRLTSKQGDELMSRVVPKTWQDVLLASVPYDALGGGEGGLSGYNHRYRTLGHDPILGWVFGPMNILSDSVTATAPFPVFFKSHSVQNMQVVGPMPTAEVFQTGIQQIEADKYNLPVAVLRQAAHFGSDYFTKQGLPLPFVGTLRNDLAKELTTRFHIDMWSVTRGAAAAALVNAVISCMHQLFYDERVHGTPKLYAVKTRKILKYSNMLASGSNILYVAISGDLRKLDIGGLLVTLYRLLTDTAFIGEIKREFISESFNQKIRGEDLQLE